MTLPRMRIEDHVPAEVFQAIGVLIVTAAGVENALLFQTMRFSGSQPPAFVIPMLSGMEFRVRLGVLKSLSHLHFAKPDAARVVKACDKLQAAFEARHLFAHGMTAPSGKPNAVKVQSSRLSGKGEFPKSQPKTAEQILQDARKIHEAAQALDDLLDELGLPHLDPSPPPSA